MPYWDFQINIDKMENKKNLSEEIIKHITLGRLKADKPCIMMIAGDSGEGKSMTDLRIGEIIEPDLDLEHQVIYTPYEYPDKMKWILFSKEGKDRHVLIMMEARELIKSTLWYTLINQVIADVNAMSRTIKPIVLILSSQDLADVDKPTRKTLTYYGYCVRPRDHAARLTLYRVCKTRHLVDNPKTHLRKLKGLVYENGQTTKMEIDKMIMHLPSESLRNRFRELDIKAKTDIINQKLTLLNEALNKEKPNLTRIEQLVEVIVKDSGILNMFLSRSKDGKIKLKPEFASIYNLDKKDFKEFEKLVEAKLAQVGMIGAGVNAT